MTVALCSILRIGQIFLVQRNNIAAMTKARLLPLNMISLIINQTNKPDIIVKVKDI